MRTKTFHQNYANCYIYIVVVICLLSFCADTEKFYFNNLLNRF